MAQWKRQIMTPKSTTEIGQFIGLHSSLMALNHSEKFAACGSKITRLSKLTELCCNSLNLARASVWELGNNGESITCQVLYTKDSGADYTPVTMQTGDNPEYFQEIYTTKLINADDALNDARTKSFTNGYLDVHGIYSMLDAPVFNGAELHSVICLESTVKRTWTLPEIAFATAVADTISQMNTYDAWQKSEKDLDTLTHRDDLTGLANYRSLKRYLEDLIADNNDREFTLLWLDIDKLKDINDAMGQLIGDQVISLCGASLNLWHNPTFNFCARIGGDEFGLVLKGNNDAKKIEEITLRLLSELDKPFIAGGQAISISASIGIACFPSDSNNLDGLLHNAEAAMYAAKAKGRAQVSFVDAKYSSLAQKRFILEQELRDVIKKNGLDVYYQPIMHADGKTLVSAEALVRWQHPEHGLLTPDAFLPIAQTSNLMADIDRCVLLKVCEDFQVLKNIDPNWGRVSLNLSADSLHIKDFASSFISMLKQYDVLPSQIQLEVTEDILQSDYSLINNTLKQLVDYGIELYLDDFGTGYSSLSRLKLYPFSKLKIDRSFIRDLMDDADDRAITLSVIALAAGMGMKVVAEGVEEEEQELWLRENGCDYFQGFKYSKPIPQAQFISCYYPQHQ
jgi:diguanylate cyclase (GGDEF)-like protein